MKETPRSRWRAVARLFLCAQVGVFAFACPRAALADDADAMLDTVYVVPAIVVEAPRIKPHIDDVLTRPGFVAVLDMSKRRNRVDDLATVLSQMVGLRVREYGGLGSFATVSIRGSSANQVDVFMDGVPLTDGYVGVTNLGDLPLDGVDRIEVYRGFTPPHLGSTAIGGAVNLVTYDDRKWGRDSALSRLEARASYGSFNTERYTGSLWSMHGPVKGFAHVGFLASDGDFAYVDDITTPENPDDDRVVTRHNNDFEQWNALGRVASDVPVLGNLSLNYNGSTREQGVPGLGAFQSETARAERDRHLGYGRWSLPRLFDERLDASATGFYSWTHEAFSDPNGEISLLKQDTDNTFRSYGGNARGKLDMPVVPVKLEVIHEAKREIFAPIANLPVRKEGPEQSREVSTTTASVDLYAHRLNLVLTAAGRFVQQKSEFVDPPRFPWLPPSPQGEITRRSEDPQVGFRWFPREYLTIKGNWGDYVRLPTMLELFGNQGSITGNGRLEPEAGTNRDIGFVLSHPRIGWLYNPFVEVVYLENDVDHLILYFPNSQYTTRPENIGSARIRGWELSLSTRVTEHVGLAGNYARLDTEDTGPIPYYHGNQLPGRPRNAAGAAIDYARDRWKVTYEYHFIGENYLDPANLRVVDARHIHNAAVQLRPVGDGVTLTLEGKNLTNNQISDVSGFPLPGRSYYVSLNYQH